MILKKKKNPSGFKPYASLDSVENNTKQSAFAVAIVGATLSLWLGLCAGAYGLRNGTGGAFLANVQGGLSAVLSEGPLYFWPQKNESLSSYHLEQTAILVAMVVMFSLLTYMRNKFHVRTNRDQGHSARWGDVKELLKKYAEFDDPSKKQTIENAEGSYNNAIMSKNFYASLDAEKHFHALNVLALGTTGSGKTRFLLKPNLLQMNASFAVTDPKGEILDSCGELLRRNGYKIVVFDVAFDALKKHTSSLYNPLRYCHQESDMRKVVEAFITNTKDPEENGGGSKDPFWDNSMKTLLLAIIGFLCTVPSGYDKPYGQIKEVTGGEEFEPCFANVIELIRKAGKEWTPNSGIELAPGVHMESSKSLTGDTSEVGAMFRNLRAFEAKRQDCDVFEIEQPYCLKEWEGVYKNPEKTWDTIRGTATTRLDPFNIAQIKNLTSMDNIDLENIACQKTAIFIIASVTDKTYNFLASMFYTQLFDALYRFGETRVDGSKFIELSNGEFVKWFSKEELERNPNAAEEYLEMAQKASIIPIGPGTITEGKNGVKFKDEYYEIRTPDGELVTTRATKAFAESFVADLKNASVKKSMTPKLPIHFRCLIDEFPNIGQIPEYKEKLSTVRGYNISSMTICQTITQLKGMYEKDYEVIDANSPFVVFLGGDENSNNEYLSKKLGKTTGKNVDNSINEKMAVSASGKTEGVELMTQDEMGRIDFGDCLVFVFSEQCIFDQKCDVKDHKNFKLTKEYYEKNGIPGAMSFNREDYYVPDDVMISWRGPRIMALPNVIEGDFNALKNAMKKFLGAPVTEAIAEKANANMKRFLFEEASVATVF